MPLDKQANLWYNVFIMMTFYILQICLFLIYLFDEIVFVKPKPTWRGYMYNYTLNNVYDRSVKVRYK